MKIFSAIILLFTCLINQSVQAVSTDSSGMQIQYYRDLLQFRAGLSNDYFDNHDTLQKFYLYTEVTSFKRPEQTEIHRVPLNISVVIDKSGSMAGLKLAYVKTAACFLIDQMTKDDFLSVVTYSDNAEVILQAGKVNDKDRIKSLINNIRESGSTNLHAGMIKGFEETKKNFQEGYVNRVLLLSDGMANIGVVTQEQLEAIVNSEYEKSKLTISTFGVGSDFNENLMTGLAEQGSGNYYFIENPEKVPEIFQKELNGLVSIIAQQTSMTFQIPKGIFIEKVFGFPFTQKNNMVTVNFGALSQEETKAALIRFRIIQPAQMQYEFIPALSFYNPALTHHIIEKLPVSLLFMKLDNPEIIQSALRHKVIEQGILFESIEMLDQATKDVDRRDFSGARRLLDYNSEFLKKNAWYVGRSIELQQQAELNKTYREKLVKAETMSVQEMKVMQKYSKEGAYKMKTKKY